MKKALFLDRDGVIIKMVFDSENGTAHPPRNISNLEYENGIFDLLNFSMKKGFLNILISNQPDIGLGKISAYHFQKIKKRIDDDLSAHQVKLDAQYFCFHHPFAEIGKYKTVCNCRKPKPGMIIKAAKDFNIDLTQSYMIGDGVNDVIAGHQAGCKTILVTNNLESENLRVLGNKLQGIKPDYTVKNLKEVIKLI